MAVNVAGIIVMSIFYLLIILVGFIAGKCFNPKSKASDHNGEESGTELAMVAGRNLGLFVGVCTLAATYVGGGFINGTAEGIATSGLAWTIAPFGIFIGTSLGGIVYGPPMIRKKYVTMLDPLQEKCGDFMTGLLFIGALLGDLFWAASIMGALGSSLTVIISLDESIAIIVSAGVALVYTLFGQMVSVAYTDILQLFFMLGGLVLCIPFAWTNEHVSDLGSTQDIWLGTIDSRQIVPWIDFAIVQTFGSIPWQTFFQRILSLRTVRQAQVSAVISGAAALLCAVPPTLIGAIAVSTDWNSTEYGTSPIGTEDVNKVLPLVLRYLTPEVVSIIGLAAVAAAVMSSMDSIILSSSSMFTHNVYRLAIRQKAGNLELKIVQGVAMLVSAVAACALAIYVNSIYTMFFLAADIVFIVMFPQLTCAIFIKITNGYGSLIGLIVGLVLRFGGGDEALNIPAFIDYQFIDEEFGLLFPFKTVAMLSSMISIVMISYLTSYLFSRGILPEKLDILHSTRTSPFGKTTYLDNEYDKGYGNSKDELTKF